MKAWVPKSPAAICGIGFGSTMIMAIDCLAGREWLNSIVPVVGMLFFGVIMVMEILRDQDDPNPTHNPSCEV